jgi:hypothetical protein
VVLLGDLIAAIERAEWRSISAWQYEGRSDRRTREAGAQDRIRRMAERAR